MSTQSLQITANRVSIDRNNVLFGYVLFHISCIYESKIDTELLKK